MTPTSGDAPHEGRLPILDTIWLASSLGDRAPGRLVLLVAVEAALLGLAPTGLRRLAIPVAYSQVAEFIVEQIIYALMTGAIVTVAYAAAEWRPCRMATAMQAGAARFVPMLLVCSAIDIAPAFTLPPSVPLNHLVSLIVGIVFAVATPVCMIERLGPVASLSRSVALTRGNRGQIFGLSLVCSGIALAALAVATMLYFGLNYHTAPLWLHSLLVVVAIFVGIPGVVFIVVATLVVTLLPTALYMNLRSMHR